MGGGAGDVVFGRAKYVPGMLGDSTLACLCEQTQVSEPESVILPALHPGGQRGAVAEGRMPWQALRTFDLGFFWRLEISPCPRQSQNSGVRLVSLSVS